MHFPSQRPAPGCQIITDRHKYASVFASVSNNSRMCCGQIPDIPGKRKQSYFPYCCPLLVPLHSNFPHQLSLSLIANHTLTDTYIRQFVFKSEKRTWKQSSQETVVFPQTTTAPLGTWVRYSICTIFMPIMFLNSNETGHANSPSSENASGIPALLCVHLQNPHDRSLLL